MSDPKS